MFSKKFSNEINFQENIFLVYRGPPSSAAVVMLLIFKGVIHLDNFGGKSVGSDMEEVIQWDKKLSKTMRFTRALTILAGRMFESPNLELQQKILLDFIG